MGNTNSGLPERINNNSKRKKKALQSSGDRISDLPDPVLHHILSFLLTKHAVRTSVLSKRWRSVWKSLPYLNFHFDSVDLVYKVLIFRETKYDIHRFRLKSHGNELVAPHVYSWMFSAIESNVRELDIDVPSNKQIEVPLCVFSCKSLTVLKLALGDWRPELALPFRFNLPNLKVFHLRDCWLRNSQRISKFISSCPSLELLEVSGIKVEAMETFVINNLNLETLVIRSINSLSGACKFQIYAPNLRAFTCNVRTDMAIDFSFEMLPCLDCADVNLEIESTRDRYKLLPAFELSEYTKQNHLQRVACLLDAIHNVESLKLSASMLVVAFESHAALDCRPLQFHNLKYLNAETWLSRDCVFAIVELLRISPKIETLVLHIIENGRSRKPLNWDERIWTSTNVFGEGQWFPEQYIFHHLKVTEIHGVIGSMNELKLVEIVLKNAMALEKMVIWTVDGMSSHRKKGLKNFCKKLLTIPQASSKIAILFF